MFKIKLREAVMNDYEDLCQVYAELDDLHRLNHPELFRELVIMEEQKDT